ncbi:hypothetical protein HA402_009168 [Bradysia odoriphaga]|nr:hypothetical protein HA402_009168 [Bradysia odoriphaga]
MDKSRRRPTTRTTRTNFVGDYNNSENINISRTIDAIDPSDTSKPSSSTATAAAATTTPTMAKKPMRTKEKEKKVKRAPTKERWLLTRKTWKYMADAGRKLIPDGVSNRPEDIPKIEEYFQNVCRNEPKFLHWRRKQSYPGALTSLRRKRRPKALGSPPKASSADEAEDERDENHHLLVMIRMLEKYLNIKEDVDDVDSQTNSHSPLSSLELQKSSSSFAMAGVKSSGKDHQSRSDTSSTISERKDQPTSTANKQTNFEATKQLSGSNYSLARSNELLKQTWLAQPIDIYDRSTDSSRKTFSPSHQFSDIRTSDPSTSASPEHSTREPNLHRSMASMHTSLLLDVLKNYSRTSKNPLLSYDRINTDVLKDKRLLRQIRDELKQQQLDRILKRHTSRSTFNLSNESTTSNIPSSTSLTSSTNKLFHFWCREPRDDRQPHTSFPNVELATFQQSRINDTATNSSKKDDRSAVPLISVKSPSHERYFYSSGIQTDPIPITYVHQLYNDYEKKKLEEKREKEENEQGGKHSRRKSSIDNEDVSQSVSDTIKRYLRMARKKNPKDNDANRFKRVNYDQTLRNIKAKGEITLPGDDDGNMKGCQTDDDWVDHVMQHIKKMERENFSPDSTDDDQLMRKQRTHFDYTQQATSAAAFKSKSSSTSPNHSSPSSPSPTGLFHSSTQFLSNLLWHSHGNSSDKPQPQQQQHPQQQMFSDDNNFPNTSTAQPHTIATTKTTMQKSKSQSNVGQVFSKKIWKSRSKSQTRTASPSESDGSGANIKPSWMPQGNCIWTSSSGKRVRLNSTKLLDLSDVERKSLHRVAIQKLTEILKSCKVPVSVPIDLSETANKVNSKPQKRRTQLLMKRKALTTSFFDSSKSKDSSRTRQSGLVFGLTLEKCIDNDQTCNKSPSTDASQTQGRVSRNSISSLGDSNIRSIQFGSCESLPAKGLQFIGQAYQDIIGTSSNVPSSSSQSDIRTDSEKADDSSCTFPAVHPTLQNVPSFFNACISFLMQHGMDVVGIFRVSGSVKRVIQLREDFDSGNIHEIHPDASPHDVAALLKEFLRELPEPLLCRSLYQGFVGTQRVRNRRLQLEALSHLIQLLPVAHRDTLYVLLHFLSHVIKFSQDTTSNSNGNVIATGNKMDAMNLATIMAPNILPTETDPTLEELDERLDVINVIRTLIDHYEEMFTVQPELMDDVYTTMMDSFPQQLDFLLERPDMFSRYEEDYGNSQPNSPPPYQVATADNTEYRLVNDGSDSNVPRRVYVRQEFTHENAAKGDTNGGVRRRERTSKMKYQEPENEISRRRRRDKPSSQTSAPLSLLQNQQPTTAVVATITTKPGTQTISSLVGSGKGRSSVGEANMNPPDSPTRRLSSPFVTHGAGVLTATFQLPVQVQMQDVKSTLSLATDLADIPYIEDGVYGGDMASDMSGRLTKRGSVGLVPQRSHSQRQYNEQMVTGSLSLGGGSVYSSASTQPQDDPKQSAKYTDRDDRPTKSIEKSSSLFTMPSRKDSRKSSTDGTSIPMTMSLASSHHNEPQLTPSISNIGGAVLRSKTADFERMLMQNKKSGSGSGESGVSMSATETGHTFTDTNTGGQIKKQPIYKRKELISSVQSSKK